MGLAAHLYQDAEDAFLCGQFLGKYGAGPDSPAWSGLARLLPYLEHGDLYRQGSIPLKALRQSGMADKQVKVFPCPGAGAGAAGPRTDAGNLPGFPVGQTNDKGVSGANRGDDLQGVGPNFDTEHPVVPRPPPRRPPVQLRGRLGPLPRRRGGAAGVPRPGPHRRRRDRDAALSRPGGPG